MLKGVKEIPGRRATTSAARRTEGPVDTTSGSHSESL